METEKKEELKHKFNLATYGHMTQYARNKLWEFFYSEIEALQAANTILEGALKYQREKSESLSTLLEAADEVIAISSMDVIYLRTGEKPDDDTNRRDELLLKAINKYNSLKKKMK